MHPEPETHPAPPVSEEELEKAWQDEQGRATTWVDEEHQKLEEEVQKNLAEEEKKLSKEN